MILEVKVIPKASRSMIKEEGTRLKAYLTAAPEKGKANKALIDLLAQYFHVKKNTISILRGAHASLKTILINQNHK
jgi:uncharacterized protein (TIGR00251 family)